MTKRVVTVDITKDGGMVIDFHNFPGKKCKEEELRMRTFLGKVGVITEVEDEAQKTEQDNVVDATQVRQRT